MARKTIVYSCIICLSIIGCKVSTYKAFQRGSTALTEFDHQAKVIVQNRLVIVPVKIQGKEYRFLLDTGAPTSISFQIQEACKFKTISSGMIKDTDRNKRKVNYVRVDTIDIDGFYFLEQTAFVADFDAHPMLGCLDLDGIIGSNLMKDANWIIDSKSEKMTIKSGPLEEMDTSSSEVAFTPDGQYNIKIKPKLGRASVSNITLDYGSNGGFTLPLEAFDKIESMGILDSIKMHIGSQQTGLFGQALEYKRKSSSSDSLTIGSLKVPHTEVRQRNSGLVGTKILNQYRVGLDWSRKKVLFEAYDEQDFEMGTYGVSFGKRDDGSVIVLSLIENGKAYHKGLRLGMKMEKLNGIEMDNDNGYCKFVEVMNDPPNKLALIMSDGEGTVKEININLD